MSVSVDVYDLGEPEQAAEAPLRPSPPRRVGVVAGALEWSAVGTALARSAPLFVPGAGHFLRREPVLGGAFGVWIACLAAIGWAVLETFDRTAAILALLDSPATSLFVTLVVLYLLAGVVHLTGVLGGVGARRRDEPDWHPVLTGGASLAVPGWGQLLNGHRVRAGLFLASLWLLGGFWLLLSPSMATLLNQYLPAVHPAEELLRQPAARWAATWTIPAVVWCLAVYDAASSAAWRRSR